MSAVICLLILTCKQQTGTTLQRAASVLVLLLLYGKRHGRVQRDTPTCVKLFDE
jgi:hypothetical protein